MKLYINFQKLNFVNQRINKGGKMIMNIIKKWIFITAWLSIFYVASKSYACTQDKIYMILICFLAITYLFNKTTYITTKSEGIK